MPFSTCCEAYTTIPEIDICPDCLEHCDCEEEDEDEIIEDQKADENLNEIQINKNQ